MVSIQKFSCATCQKLGNLPSQTGDKVARLCCVSNIGLSVIRYVFLCTTQLRSVRQQRQSQRRYKYIHVQCVYTTYIRWKWCGDAVAKMEKI